MKHQGKMAGLTRRVCGFLLPGMLLLSAGSAFGSDPFTIICDGEATAVSENGSVIVGIDAETRETWRWTEKSGRVLLGPSSGPANETNWGAPDVSDDGRIISATVLPAESESESLAAGLSGDGSILVGQVRVSAESSQAAFWKSDRGLTLLGGDGTNSRANNTNADGSVIVGWSEDSASGIWQPTAWIDGRTTILAATKAFCEAMAVNAGGNMIVGQAYDETRDQKAAALWLNSDFGWVQEWLGTLPGTMGGYGQSMALDLTDDGHTIVGFNRYDPNRSVGFIWTLEDGLSEARQFLVDRGATLPEGFQISAITGISGDGSYLTGYGEDTTFWPHQTRSFLVRVKALPREKPRVKILPAGSDISNPFKTRDLE